MEWIILKHQRRIIQIYRKLCYTLWTKYMKIYIRRTQPIQKKMMEANKALYWVRNIKGSKAKMGTMGSMIVNAEKSV